VSPLPNPPLAPEDIAPGQALKVNDDGDNWDAYTPGEGGGLPAWFLQSSTTGSNGIPLNVFVPPTSDAPYLYFDDTQLSGLWYTPPSEDASQWQAIGASLGDPVQGFNTSNGTSFLLGTDESYLGNTPDGENYWVLGMKGDVIHIGALDVYLGSDNGQVILTLGNPNDVGATGMGIGQLAIDISFTSTGIWTWNGASWDSYGGGGGGRVGAVLSLAYAGQGPFDVPCFGVPADWAEGQGSLGATLIVGTNIASGVLLNTNGDPIPDGWTFSAFIFVEGTVIYDILAVNTFQDNATGGFLAWGDEGGLPTQVMLSQGGVRVTTPSTSGAGITLTDNGEGGIQVTSNGATGQLQLQDQTDGGSGVLVFSDNGSVDVGAGSGPGMHFQQTDLVLVNWPTDDPHVLGAVWLNDGVLTASAG
jgi:hypothetical protein